MGAVHILCNARAGGVSSSVIFCYITGGGQKLRTSSLVLPVADNIFKYQAKQRQKIVSKQKPQYSMLLFKNAVCYRKEKAAGTQFLPYPCDIGGRGVKDWQFWRYVILCARPHEH